MFFFFQAEDGIRDTSVTGVQTCALPIFQRGKHGEDRRLRLGWRGGARRGRSGRDLGHAVLCRAGTIKQRGGRFPQRYLRSEERRVGKEWRVWWLRRGLIE